MKLYEQNDELLNSIIDPETGEILTASITDNLNELSTALIAKIKNINAEIDVYKAEITRLKDIMDSKKYSVESAKDFLKSLMENNDIKKIEDGVHKVTLRKPTAKVVITDETKLSTKYIKTKEVTQIDKVAIKEALKVGKVDGAEFEYNTSLLIK